MSWYIKEVDCEHPVTGEKTFINVIPDFGRKHEPHPDCWCNPERDQNDETLLIHNTSN